MAEVTGVWLTHTHKERKRETERKLCFLLCFYVAFSYCTTFYWLGGDDMTIYWSNVANMASRLICGNDVFHRVNEIFMVKYV